MQTEREVVIEPTAPPRELILRSPPNWTYTLFFGCLGLLHLVIVTTAIVQGHWTGAYLSLILGALFVIVACMCYCSTCEFTILPAERRIRLRSGIGPFSLQRYIPFADVHGVRLTMTPHHSYPANRIEVLCDNEDIECPPTSVPRQQALCLAMLMGVRLIKVSGDEQAARV